MASAAGPERWIEDVLPVRFATNVSGASSSSGYPHLLPTFHSATFLLSVHLVLNSVYI